MKELITSLSINFIGRVRYTYIEEETQVSLYMVEYLVGSAVNF